MPTKPPSAHPIYWQTIAAVIATGSTAGGIYAGITHKSAVKSIGIGIAGATLWELAWWYRRRLRRTTQFALAQQDAQRLGRPLIVIGAPDAGATSGYGCGDETIDIAGSSCPNTRVLDIVKNLLPYADNSVVVFCPCVLEYVSDALPAIREIQRVSGGHAFFVGVEPWTLTAYTIPDARRKLPPAYR